MSSRQSHVMWLVSGIPKDTEVHVAQVAICRSKNIWHKLKIFKILQINASFHCKKMVHTSLRGVVCKHFMTISELFTFVIFSLFMAFLREYTSIINALVGTGYYIRKINSRLWRNAILFQNTRLQSKEDLLWPTLTFQFRCAAPAASPMRKFGRSSAVRVKNLGGCEVCHSPSPSKLDY